MFKRFIRWLFNIDECRSKLSMKTSIAGKPLLEFNDSRFGWSIKQTPEGLQGAHLAICITQLGENVETIKRFLNHEYDNYFSKEDNERLIASIQHRLDKGGYYFETKMNKSGYLDLVKVMWSQEDKVEITKLLEEG